MRFEREGVLAAPVTALAGAGKGRLAVIVPGGGPRPLVVRPRTAAGGYVDIVGGDLAEGAEVLLPTRTTSR